VVVSPHRKWKCSVCRSKGGGLLTIEDSRPVCLVCADLDHLMFLPSGDEELSAQAMANSCLSAVVLRFTRRRKRFEREGVLVEEAALELAETQCLGVEEARSRRSYRDTRREAADDRELQDRIAEEIARQFPGCARERARAIAAQAATRGSRGLGRSGSGRDGRSADEAAPDPEAVTLAVVTAVRHGETPYDELLMSGLDRAQARARVQEQVSEVLDGWRRD
jgi:hypothetical protein